MGMLESFKTPVVLYLQFFSMICAFLTENSSFHSAKPQKLSCPSNQHNLQLVLFCGEWATRTITIVDNNRIVSYG